MKKVFALMLALVMALSLVACGGGSKDESKDYDKLANDELLRVVKSNGYTLEEYLAEGIKITADIDGKAVHKYEQFGI